MSQELIQKHSKYFFVTCLVGIILFSVVLIRSFIITILTAIILTYIFYPLYLIIKKGVRSERVASLITTLLVVIIIIVPFVFAANALVNESVLTFQNIREVDISGIEEQVSEVFGERVEVVGYVRDSLNKISLALAKSTSEFIVSLPQKIVKFFVMLFVMFYLFIEGTKLASKIGAHVPLKESHRKNLSEKFVNVIRASVYGMIVTAFAQGVVGALGLWIFGVKSPILWGLVMAILALIPLIGTAPVWLTAALYKIFTGEMFNGVGLLLYGVLIISTIDNVLRPKIVGQKAKIHPVIAILGIFGGLELFGFVGLIIGPLVLAILSVFIELYFLEEDNHAKESR